MSAPSRNKTRKYRYLNVVSFGIDFGVQPLEQSVWRDEAFLKNKYGLRNPGQTTPTLKVADIGLHRSTL
jgi:hypothetical protein